MSTTSINICRTFQQMRDFCEQVSLLLGAADTFFQKANWTPQEDTTVFTEISYAISTPQRWLPFYFFRFFRCTADFPRVLAYISVIVNDVYEPDRVSQALISAGWLDFGEEIRDWEWWYARSHLWSPERTDDGTLCWQEPSRHWKSKPAYNIQRIGSFAYPVHEIVSGAVLKERVVDRLLAEIISAHSRTHADATGTMT